MEKSQNISPSKPTDECLKTTSKIVAIDVGARFVSTPASSLVNLSMKLYEGDTTLFVFISTNIFLYILITSLWYETKARFEICHQSLAKVSRIRVKRDKKNMILR